MYKHFGEDYRKAVRKLNTLRDAKKKIFKSLKISRFGK